MRRPFPKLTDIQLRKAEALCICTSTLHVRLHRGWLPEVAVTTSVRERNLNGQRARYLRWRTRRQKLARALIRFDEQQSVAKYLAAQGLA